PLVYAARAACVAKRLNRPFRKEPCAAPARYTAVLRPPPSTLVQPSLPSFRQTGPVLIDSNCDSAMKWSTPDRELLQQLADIPEVTLSGFSVREGLAGTGVTVLKGRNY